jgi:hypothetical protein
MASDTSQFESLVRDYLKGTAEWNVVHRYVMQLESENKTDFPIEFRRPLEELHMIFLADAEDDPQFRADRTEISAALAELDRLRADVKTLGRAIVARRELDQERRREESSRLKFIAKYEARKKRKLPQG